MNIILISHIESRRKTMDISLIISFLSGVILMLITQFIQFLYSQKTDDKKRKWQLEDEKRIRSREVKLQRLAQIEEYARYIVSEVIRMNDRLNELINYEIKANEARAIKSGYKPDDKEKGYVMTSIVHSFNDEQLNSGIKKLEFIRFDIYGMIWSIAHTSDLPSDASSQFQIKCMEHFKELKEELATVISRLDYLKSQ